MQGKESIEFKQKVDRAAVLRDRAQLAGLTFPNDEGGYVRRQRKDRPAKPLTPDERFARLQAAFMEKAKTPAVHRQNPPKGTHVIVRVLGKPCRVAKRDWKFARESDEMRRQVPQDLSVNAAAERRSRGLDPFAFALSRYRSKVIAVKVPMRPTRLKRQLVRETIDHNVKVMRRNGYLLERVAA